jgi:hypothetical protein
MGTVVTSCHIQSGPFPLATHFDDWLVWRAYPSITGWTTRGVSMICSPCVRRSFCGYQKNAISLKPIDKGIIYSKGMTFGEVYETPLDEYDVARVGARYYQVTDTLLTQELISIWISAPPCANTHIRMFRVCMWA